MKLNGCTSFIKAPANCIDAPFRKKAKEICDSYALGDCWRGRTDGHNLTGGSRNGDRQELVT